MRVCILFLIYSHTRIILIYTYIYINSLLRSNYLAAGDEGAGYIFANDAYIPYIYACVKP